MKVVIGIGQRMFEVESPPEATVLDAIEALGMVSERPVLYRHSCHHGSCGTCGALVNGTPRLMCLTPLGSLPPGPILLEPLPKSVPLGDLAVEPVRFVGSMPDTGYLRKSEVEHPEPNPDGRSWRRFESCIECGLCLAACPVERPFAGPAALAALDREREERPEHARECIALAAAPEGVAACDRAFACSRVCPQGVAPGRRIGNLRTSIADQADPDGTGGVAGRASPP